MNKYLSIAIAILCFGSGMFLSHKLTKAPICNCPDINIPKCPPSNKIQTIDFDKLRKIKGNVNLEQVFNGDVYLITEKDTIKQN